MSNSQLAIYSSALDSSASSMRIDASITPVPDPPAKSLRVDAEIDVAGAIAATVESIEAQKIIWSVVTTDQTGGTDTILPSQIKSISVSMGLHDWLRSWQLEILIPNAEPVATDDRYAGLGYTQFDNAFVMKGQSHTTSKRKVTISCAYVVKNPAGGFSYYWRTLIKDGVVDSASRAHTPDGIVERITGVDNGGFFDGALVDLILPPGHGLPRRRVIETAARRAGVEDVSLSAVITQVQTGWTHVYNPIVPPPAGADPDTTYFYYAGMAPLYVNGEQPMMKEFQMSDAQFLGPCQELADVDGMRLMWDDDGTLIWRRSGKPTVEERAFTWLSISEHQWKNFTVTSQHKGGTVITEIIVEGTEQLVYDPCAPGAAGDQTSVQEIKTFSMNGPIFPAFHQGAGDVYTANGPGGTPSSPILTRHEIIERTSRIGTEVHMRRMAYSYFNPESARYQYDLATSSWETIAGVYTDDDGSGDAIALQTNSERWMLTEVDEEWYYYNDPNFTGPVTVAGLPAFIGSVDFSQPVGDTEDEDLNFDMVKIGEMKVSWRFYGPRGYQKARASGADAWEDQEPPDNHVVYGDKSGVASTDVPGWIPNFYSSYAGGDGERLLPVSVILSSHESDGRGYRTADRVQEFGWFARPGSTYLYADQTERGDEAETFQYIGATETVNIGSGDQSHDEVVIKSNYNGVVYETQQTTGVGGYIPAIDRIPNTGHTDPELEPDVYADQAEIDAIAKSALRTNVQQFAVYIKDHSLDLWHVKNVTRLSAPYAENPAEAERMGRQAIDDSAAPTISGEMNRVNIWISPGEPANISCIPLGLRDVVDPDEPTNILLLPEGRIETVELRYSATGGTTQNVTAKLYTWEEGTA